jgi:acetyl-CoA carboxylase biotin carboxylase subunit
MDVNKNGRRVDRWCRPPRKREGGANVRRVLIANRGEIALRAVRACRRLGIETVAVHSTADANSPHVWAADRSVCIGPPSARLSYLHGDALVEVALRTGCNAVYPGYGFLSERSAFAARVAAAGLTFVGPDAATIATMGDKVAARQAARDAGIPVVPGSDTGFARAVDAERAARDIGFPLLLKAAAGGGGRGMRVCWEPAALAKLFEQAAAEAQAAFGDATLYLERYFPRVRHIEIQVFGDAQGRIVHLWERDCSVQRRHQKLVEEAPSPVLTSTERRAIAEAATTLARAIGYVNAGTVEFIFDLENRGFYFIEMNTRIQVEHPVTEAITGLDLVAEQFRVAAGEPLSFDQPAEPQGAAIEFRINAEDPDRGFAPDPGLVRVWRPPAGPGIRIDSHVYAGYAVSPFYDSLLAKLIVSDTDRAATLELAAGAFDQFAIDGVATTLSFHRALLCRSAFREATLDTQWVDRELMTQRDVAA